MYRAILKRLHTAKEVIKGNKSEAGIVGKFIVYDDAGTEVLELYSMENSGQPTDLSGFDKPIVPRVYNLCWANSSVCVPPKYKKAHKLGLNKALWLHDPNNPKFADRRIMIHIGNNAIDTLGCILLGCDYDKASGQITHSTKAVEAFYDFVEEHGTDNITLQVIGLKDEHNA